MATTTTTPKEEEWFNAIQAGDTEKVKEILSTDDGKSLLNSTNSLDGQTALCIAASTGLENMATLLLDNGADINAKTSDDLHTALTLSIPAGGSIASSLLSEGSSSSMITMLMATANAQRESMVKMLIERGADVKFTNVLGETALHIASRNGQANTAKLLLENGASVNAKTNDGQTAYDLADDNVRAILSQFGGNSSTSG